MQHTIILTGATGAIGREIAARIAADIHHTHTRLLLACRNTPKAEELARHLRQQYPDTDIAAAYLDLLLPRTIHQFAEMLTHENIGTLALVNNAGVMQRRFDTDASEREISLAVNYFNTRLLTELLLHSGRLRRVVFTTSLTRFFYRAMCQSPDKIRITAKNFHQLRTYGLSKRLITDYAAELHATGKVEAACADPGIVNTGMITMQRWYDSLANHLFRPLIRTPRAGSLPACRALTATPGYIYCAHRRHKLPHLSKLSK